MSVEFRNPCPTTRRTTVADDPVPFRFGKKRPMNRANDFYFSLGAPINDFGIVISIPMRRFGSGHKLILAKVWLVEGFTTRGAALSFQMFIGTLPE